MKMTKFSFLSCIVLFCFFPSLQAQKKVGIHHLTFSIDQAMITEKEVNRKGGGFLSGYSESIILPQYLTDSVITTAQRVFSKKFKTEVDLIWVKTKKGKPFATTSISGGMDKESVEGLPAATFKKATEASKKDLYLQIIVSIEDGTSVNLDLPKSKKKIKPIITMNVKAFDRDKKVKWKNDVKIKDWDKLVRKTKESDTHTFEKGETLTPEMILEMYAVALAEVVKG